MNKWQEIYCRDYCDGKMPRAKIGKKKIELLGYIKSKVIVHFPDRTEELFVTENESDFPNGKISVEHLAANLILWTDRGYQIETG